MATPEEAVSAASAKFGTIESSVQKAIDNLNKLPAHFKDVWQGGPLEVPEGVKQFGYLEASMFAAEAQVLAGEAARLQAEIVAFHRRCADRAIELNIDGISAMGGGGR